MGKKPSILILLLLMPFASISAVLFTPALPEIAELFKLSEATTGASVTVFLLGYALGNIPYGPFAKRYGRKKAICLGVFLSIIGLLLILAGGHILSWGLFLFGRFLSGLGSSVGMKISFTMIGDAFSGSEATKTMSLSTLAFAIAPGLSIAFGGFLTAAYGWQSCFYALFFYSIGIAFATLFLPETAPSLDLTALNLTKIRMNYIAKLKQRSLLYSALIMGAITSILYFFSTFAPFIGIKRIGLSTRDYGLMNFIPAIGLIAGSLVSHCLSSRVPSIDVIGIGVRIATVSIVPMLIMFMNGTITAWSLFLPMPFLYFGTSLIYNNASILALKYVDDKSNASAVMGFLSMVLATVTVFATQAISFPYPSEMPLFFLVVVGVMIPLHKQLRGCLQNEIK